MLTLQSADRFAAVAKRPDDDGHLVVYARVGEDAARDLRVCGAELNRVEPGLARHNPGHAQRAVAAVSTQLKQETGLSPLGRTVQDLALFVADVDEKADVPAEVIDNSNSVVDVTGAGVGYDVFLERLFPPAPTLPLS